MWSRTFSKTKDVNSQLAALRPGDESRNLNGILATATSVKREHGVYSWPEFRLILNENGQVQKCEFSSRFPAHIAIEKLHIGMPISEAVAIEPSLRFFTPQSFGDGYDLVLDDKPWDLLIDEVSDKIQRISIVPKGQADERFAKGQALLEGRLRAWNKASESGHWMTLDDPYELLDEWLQAEQPSAPWNDYPTNITTAYASWLRKASPDEWHQAALGHNWSYDIAPLFFISRHQDCDLATALHIFYATDPKEMAKHNFDPSRTDRHRDLRLVLGIRDRVLSGFYTRKELRFDPKERFGLRWTPLDLGPEFPEFREGREPASLAIDDGYPLEVWKAAQSQE